MATPAGLASPTPRAGQRAGRYHWLIIPLLVFAVWRGLTLVAGWQSVQRLPFEPPAVIYDSDAGRLLDMELPDDSPLYDWLEPWHRWDSGWYLMNAVHPFTYDTSAAFAPLVSLLTAAVAPLTGFNYVLAGLLVTNVACAASFVLLYRLVIADFGNQDLALRTLLVLAAFPTAFFLTAIYAESLFLLLVLLTFFAARNRRWWLAGLAAGLATLARMQGLVLIAPLAWMAFQWAREQSAHEPGRWAWVRRALPALPALAGPVVAWALFTAVVAARGLPSTGQVMTAVWHSSFQAPWVSVLAFFERIASGQVTLNEIEGAAALVFACAAAVTMARRFQLAYTWYVLASIVLFFALTFEGPQFPSNARHVLVLFPCFVALAIWLKTPRRTWLFVLLSAVFQLWLILRFTHWGWVA